MAVVVGCVIALPPVLVTHTRRDTWISDRSVFARPLPAILFFTTTSKPIRNTKNLAMQVGETRIRFRKVLVKYARRQWDSKQVLYESELFTFRARWMNLLRSRDYQSLSTKKIILFLFLFLFIQKNNFERFYLTCLEYLITEQNN